MKKLCITAICICLYSNATAQTVDVEYLNPILGSTELFKFTRFGTPTNYSAGFMHNNTSTLYGDGDDFSIFTYNNRDMTFRTGTGNFIVFPSSGGNMGIGTASPTQKLEIYNQNLFNTNMEAQNQDHITFSSTIGGDNTFFGGITWKTGSRRRASIAAAQEHSDSDHIGIGFFTKGTDGPGPIYEAMRLSHDGNLGIGITEPQAKLDVNGNIKVTASGGAWITGKTGTGGITSSTQLSTSAYHSLLRQKTASGHVINLGGLGDDFGFFGYDKDRTTNGYDYSMIMDLKNGNIGIGKTEPLAKLDVNGNINVKAPGGAWITGKTGTGGITASTQQSSSAYHALLRQKTASGHIINLGGLNDVFGFFGYDKDRTANGYDHSMVMDLENGNVGIGKINPKHKLDVNTGAGNFKTYNYGIEYTVNTTGGWARGFRLRNENDNNTAVFGAVNGHAYIATGFDLDADATGYQNQKLTVLTNGDVGIGISAPSSKLHVKGDDLGVLAEDKSILSTIEGSISGSNKSKFQILNKRNSDGTDWFDTSLRLQKVIDNTEQAFIDFGIEGKRADYGLAFGTRNGFSGTQETRMVIQSDGKVGIGTKIPDAMLTVAGNIHSREVKVTIDAGADFVFEDDYNLMPLETLEDYLTNNKHLPEVASAKEMEQDGIELSKMNIKLLQKIEELTLYLIEQNKKIKKLEKEVSALKK